MLLNLLRSKQLGSRRGRRFSDVLGCRTMGREPSCKTSETSLSSPNWRHGLLTIEWRRTPGPDCSPEKAEEYLVARESGQALQSANCGWMVEATNDSCGSEGRVRRARKLAFAVAYGRTTGDRHIAG